MNVIDGQAVQIICFSLIFYSLTIDNILNIIVLLILAGVTIVTLTGENGIIKQTKNAKSATDIAEVKEQAQLDIANWRAERLKNGQDVNLNDATVKSIIESANENNANKYYSEITETTLKTKQGNEILLSDLYSKTGGSDTPSFDANTLTIGEAINTDKYGWKVKNYTVTTDEFTTGVWRLFYQDNNYAYLVTDECVGSYKPREYYTNYTSGADVSTVGQKLNPQLLENGTFFTSTNKNGNICATAWLTDTSETGMWNAYKNEDAVFAIRKSNIRIIYSIIQ